MARIFSIYYNKDLKKAFKKERVFCEVGEDGRIYVSNGYAIYTMTAYEYREFIQPVTLREPGKWALEADGQPCPRTIELAKYFRESWEKNCTRSTCRPAPFSFCAKHGETVTGYYSTDGDFCTVTNSIYTDGLEGGYSFMSEGSASPLFMVHGETPVAMVLPIRFQADAPELRAVKAYFVEPVDESDALKEARSTIERLGDTVSDQDRVISRLEKELADAKAYMPTEEERREALDRLNRAQNAANEFANITEQDIKKEVERGNAPTVEAIAFLPRVFTFTTQTGPRTISSFERRHRCTCHLLTRSGREAA